MLLYNLFFPVGSIIGLVHLLASILALIFGTLVLVKKKGTSTHVKMGYIYVAGMLVLNVTAFMQQLPPQFPPKNHSVAPW